MPKRQREPGAEEEEEDATAAKRPRLRTSPLFEDLLGQRAIMTGINKCCRFPKYKRILEEPERCLLEGVRAGSIPIVEAVQSLFGPYTGCRNLLTLAAFHGHVELFDYLLEQDKALAFGKKRKVGYSPWGLYEDPILGPPIAWTLTRQLHKQTRALRSLERKFGLPKFAFVTDVVRRVGFIRAITEAPFYEVLAYTKAPGDPLDVSIMRNNYRQTPIEKAWRRNDYHIAKVVFRLLKPEAHDQVLPRRLFEYGFFPNAMKAYLETFGPEFWRAAGNPAERHHLPWFNTHRLTLRDIEPLIEHGFRFHPNQFVSALALGQWDLIGPMQEFARVLGDEEEIAEAHYDGVDRFNSLFDLTIKRDRELANRVFEEALTEKYSDEFDEVLTVENKFPRGFYRYVLSRLDVDFLRIYARQVPDIGSVLEERRELVADFFHTVVMASERLARAVKPFIEACWELGIFKDYIANRRLYPTTFVQDSPNPNETPFLSAVCSQKTHFPGLVRFLIEEAGADPHVKCQCGLTAMDYALLFANERTVADLHDSGVVVEFTSPTVVHRVFGRGILITDRGLHSFSPSVLPHWTPTPKGGTPTGTLEPFLSPEE